MTHLNPKQQQAIQAIVARAEVDPAFRASLLRQPVEAIQRTFGVALPPGFRVRFVERDPSVDLLVVLTDPADEAGELSEDQLESVAGGVTTDGAWADAIVASTSG